MTCRHSSTANWSKGQSTKASSAGRRSAASPTKRLPIPRAGGDAFTAAIGHGEGTSLIVDTVYERRPPFDAANTIDEVAYLAHSYRVSTIFGDDYGADITAGSFRRQHITYKPLRLGDAEGGQGKLNRSEIYLDTVPLFTAGRVKLPDNPRLVHQLISLERRAARSGHDTVDHPPSGHDDLANAVAGLLVALAGRGGAVH
jgi:hypothetical protein